jgi:hypothetical protein
MASLAAITVALIGAPTAHAGGTAAGIPSYFAEVTGPAVNVKGTYEPIVGSFTTSGLDDILWYSYRDTDSIWSPCQGCEAGPFTKSRLGIQLDAPDRTTFEPIVGDFAGDSHDDIIWYPWQGGRTTYLWTSHGREGFTRSAIGISANYSPTVLHDHTPGGKDDVLWRNRYQFGASPLFVFPDDGSGIPTTAARLALPVVFRVAAAVADFDGDGLDDIVFMDGDYAFWRRTCGTCGTFVERNLDVRRTYFALVGQFAGRSDGPADILWLGLTKDVCGRAGCTYADGPDKLWKGTDDGAFSSSTQFAPTTYGLTLRHPGHDLALIYPYDAASIWSAGSHVVGPAANRVPFDESLIEGRFTTPGYDDLLSYHPGSTPETLYAART